MTDKENTRPQDIISEVELRLLEELVDADFAHLTIHELQLVHGRLDTLVRAYKQLHAAQEEK